MSRENCDEGIHVYTRWFDGEYRCYWCGLRRHHPTPGRERWTYEGVESVAGLRYYLWREIYTGRRFGWQVDLYKRRTTA